jgi:hypothetical protein
MVAGNEARRSQALDLWDYRVPFARFHIHWGEGTVMPAFEQAQAFAIVEQELHIAANLELLGHREVLVTFSSDHVEVAGKPARGEPVWVVIVAGRRRPAATASFLQNLPEGAGVIMQALVHARTGEIVLGTAVPVRLNVG